MTMEPGYGERPSTGTSGGGGTGQARVSDAAKEEARVVREHMRSQAKEARERARARAASSFEDQKGRFAHEAGGLAAALRETAERLEQQNQEGVAVYVRSAANLTDRVARSIDQQDYGGFANSVDRVARREPLLVFAGAAALGFLASQAIRSAREESHEPGGPGAFEEESSMSSGAEGPAY